MVRPLKVGIVGVGKIARDQHVPALRANSAFELVACASRHATVEGVANFATLDTLLAGARDVDAIVLCTPPQYHFEAARLALGCGKHVFLEKPPCETTRELDLLEHLARESGLTLFQSWHSRHAAGVEAARQWLSSRAIRSIAIAWKEDVRKWHPGQAWIWQAGGFGVFDPGINALSILTRIVSQPVLAKRATLFVPANCEAPIAADIAMETADGVPTTAVFDFRQSGEEIWNIEIETDGGTLKLAEGGARLFLDGRAVAVDGNVGEYPSLYRHFSQLVRRGECDVDTGPFRLVADIFLVAKRVEVEAFE